MSYEEYQRRSIDLAQQVSDKMHIAINGFDDCMAFVNSKNDMDENVFSRLQIMLIECCKKRFLEIITMFEEIERLISDNEPDIDERIKLIQLNSLFRAKFEDLHEMTRKFMEKHKTVLT